MKPVNEKQTNPSRAVQPGTKLRRTWLTTGAYQKKNLFWPSLPDLCASHLKNSGIDLWRCNNFWRNTFSLGRKGMTKESCIINFKISCPGHALSNSTVIQNIQYANCILINVLIIIIRWPNFHVTFSIIISAAQELRSNGSTCQTDKILISITCTKFGIITNTYYHYELWWIFGCQYCTVPVVWLTVPWVSIMGEP